MIFARRAFCYRLSGVSSQQSDAHALLAALKIFPSTLFSIIRLEMYSLFHYINLQTNNRQLYELTLSGDQRERFNKLVRTLGQS